MKHKIKIYYCEEIPEQISQHSLAYLLLEEMLKRNFPEEAYSMFLHGHPKYARTTQGKPYLADFPKIQFNISHCPACVACAIGKEPAGVDVERRFPWKETLVRRVCHPKEREVLEGLKNPEEKQACLNRIWSRKESYLKYLGIGLRCDLREFCVLEPEMVHLEDCCFLELQTDRFTLAACGRNGSRMEVEKIDFSLLKPGNDGV